MAYVEHSWLAIFCSNGYEGDRGLAQQPNLQQFTQKQKFLEHPPYIITSSVFGGEFGVSSPCNCLFMPSDPRRGWTEVGSLLLAARLAVPHGAAGNTKNPSPSGLFVLP